MRPSRSSSVLPLLLTAAFTCTAQVTLTEYPTSWRAARKCKGAARTF